MKRTHEELLHLIALATEDRTYANNSKVWAEANRRVHALERELVGLRRADGLPVRHETERVVR